MKSAPASANRSCTTERRTFAAAPRPPGRERRVAEQRAQQLDASLLAECAVGHEGHRAIHAHARDVHRRFAVEDPLRHERADATGQQDAERVEPARGEEPAELGCLAQQRSDVGREALRPAEELADAGVVQRREPVHRIRQESGHPVPVGRKHGEPEVLRDPIEGPRRGLRLEQPDEDAAGLLAVVAVAVRVLHHRQVGVRPLDRVGQQVVVLGRLQGHRDAGQRAELTPPHAGGDHDGLGLDRTAVGLDAGDAAAGRHEARDRHALDDLGAAHAGAFRVGLRDVGRVRPSLVGHPGRGEDVVDLRGGPVAGDLLRADELDRHAVRLGEGRLPGDGLHPLRRAGEVQVPDPAEPRVLPGLLGQLRQEVGGVARHPQEGLGRHARRGDQPRRVPGGAGGELLALQQDHVAHAGPRQVIGDAAPDHAAADDDDPGALGERAVRHGASCCWRAGGRRPQRGHMLAGHGRPAVTVRRSVR